MREPGRGNPHELLAEREIGLKVAGVQGLVEHALALAPFEIQKTL